MNLIVNRFGNAILALSSKECPSVQNSGEGTTAVCINAENDDTKRSEEGPKGREEGVNPWYRKPYINVNFENDKSFLSEDGIDLRLHKPNVDSNSARLQFSVEVVFGRDIPVQRIAMELCRQWSHFGKFHLTILGLGCVLCSFFSYEAMMLNLPLYCWDEINVARIASLIGTPMMLDGNMFQWKRREFARISVRVELDKQLPLGIWVEGVEGRFFQIVEYEKSSSFCYKCGKIGHVKRVYEKDNSWVLSEGARMNNCEATSSDNVQHTVDNVVVKDSIEGSLYGPWDHVHNRRKRRYAAQSRKSVGGDVGTSLGASEESYGRGNSKSVSNGTVGGSNGLSLPIISKNNMFNVLGSIEEEGEIVKGSICGVPVAKEGVEGELFNSQSTGFTLEEVVTSSDVREKGLDYKEDVG
ncbi:hypothetical protein M5K25_004720, partial [Dendrobium thyrsiflorum]